MTTVKPETVSVYQVKKTEKDTYKKRTNWRLKDLRLIDGRDETNVRTSKKVLTSSNDSQQDLCVIICYNLTYHSYSETSLIQISKFQSYNISFHIMEMSVLRRKRYDQH